MVGLALEVHETAKLKKQLAQLKAQETEATATGLNEIKLSLEYRGVAPSFLDVFHYAFCYIGVLTGNLHTFVWFFGLAITISVQMFRSILQVQNLLGYATSQI